MSNGKFALFCVCFLAPIFGLIVLIWKATSTSQLFLRGRSDDAALRLWMDSKRAEYVHSDRMASTVEAPSEVGIFLKGCNLGNYGPAFEESRVTKDMLLSIATFADLEAQFGEASAFEMTRFELKRLFQAIKISRGTGTIEAQTSGSETRSQGR